MIPLSVIENYVCDQNEGMRGLITWFLNLVMQFEADGVVSQSFWKIAEPCLLV